MHYHFIVNPIAGAGRAKECFETVKELFAENGSTYSVVYTERQGHATELATEAKEAGEKCIVAVGGDGTFNEVAAALVNEDCAVGLLPFGTGNDISRILGIPNEPKEAALALLNSGIHRMDVGKLNSRYFFNIAGAGFDVDVLINTEQYKAKYEGGVPYILGVLRSIAKKRSLPVTVKLDGKQIDVGQLLMLSIANGTHFGGGMMVAPNANPFDGLFDVIMTKYINTLHFLCIFPGFIKGKHLKYKCITCYRAKKIEVFCQDPYPTQIDGEITEFLPATFELLEGALKIVSPSLEINKSREVELSE